MFVYPSYGYVYCRDIQGHSHSTQQNHNVLSLQNSIVVTIAIIAIYFVLYNGDDKHFS